MIVPYGQSTRPTVVYDQVRGSPEWQLVEAKEGPGLYLPFESVLNAADWNEDGDLDLMALASYGYLCWYERTFLEHGYAAAELTQIEAR
jgi:hypothetical protein